MSNTEEIFNILSRGGFIASNSVSPQIKRYYDLIEDDFQAYSEYYQAIGFSLEGGDGYYFFARKESKVDLERKLVAAEKWIDYLAFLKTFNASFGPGMSFRSAEIEMQINCDMELKDLASKLLSEKKVSYGEVVEKLIKELLGMGFIELENDLDGTYKVLTSFRYIEDLIDCINIQEEEQDEISQ